MWFVDLEKDNRVDALNRRVAKEVNGTIIEKYLWEDLTTLLSVYDGSDRLVWRFEYADQRMPVAMTDASGAKYYLHYDQVGSLRAVSDANGNVVKAIAYDTYGNILRDTNPGYTVPFGFAGGLYDPDTKLTHFGFREYDSFTGKWTAKDPISFAGGDSNLYGYVLGDPVDLVDPWGLSYKDMLSRALARLSRNKVNALLNGARLYKTQGKQKIYEKLGNYDDAFSDLRKLTDNYSIRNDKLGERMCIGELDDGRPTLEIQSKNYKYKVRYQKWILPDDSISPLFGLFF